MSDKIIITVPRKKRSPARSGGSPKRGPIISKRKPEYLSRRRTAKGISFYDLGQILIDGNWATRTANITLPDDPFNPTAAEYVPINEFFNAPLAVENWHTSFRKVEPALGSKYAIRYQVGSVDEFGDVDLQDEGDSVSSNEHWTAQGLTVDEAFNFLAISLSSMLDEDFRPVYSGLSMPIFTPLTFRSPGPSSPANKITTEADADADAAEAPTLSIANGPIDVFLSPAIFSKVSIVSNTPEVVNTGSEGSPQDVTPPHKYIGEPPFDTCSQTGGFELWQFVRITEQDVAWEGFIDNGENAKMDVLNRADAFAFETSFEDDIDVNLDFIRDCYDGDFNETRRTFDLTGKRIRHNQQFPAAPGIPMALCYNDETVNFTSLPSAFLDFQSGTDNTSSHTIDPDETYFLSSTFYNPAETSDSANPGRKHLIGAIHQSGNWWYVWSLRREATGGG